ncbi:MAG: protein kinase [Pirellulales bacterium]
MSTQESDAARIFLDALENCDTDRRSQFVNEACGENPQLRARVFELLGALAEPNSLLDGGGAIATLELTPLEKPGAQIGPYKLLEQIGEGGFGVVFLAEQATPIRRRVALKIVKPGMDTRQVVGRFEAERQALALMDHPGIAKVFDAGVTEQGRSYFVMELVAGVPINEYCDQCNLPTRERLELFMAVCQAVQHAHQKGIIHRDLKPTNVLVTLQDGRPMPKIIDFGIAKAIDERLTEHTLTTGYAQMVGTPMYMSPEQAELSRLGVDTRTDIYSLGVLLYELLAGTTPFDKDRLHAASYDELRRIIREEEPPLPSTRLTTLAAGEATTIAEHRRSDARKLGQSIRGDLDWIAMKCLEKDRNRRYDSAGSLARDVERYLHDEPVQACPPSASYRFRKFAQRNFRVLAAAGAIALTLCAALGLSTLMYLRERAALEVAKEKESLATTEAAKSQLVARFMTEMLKGVAPGVALGRDTQLLREILDKTANRLDELRDQPEVEADLRATLGSVYAELGEYQRATEMHRAALAIRKSLYGDEHPSVAQSLDDLGGVSYWDARWNDAAVLHREAVELRRQLRSDRETLVEAAELYRELLDLDPHRAAEHGYHLRLAETLLRTQPLDDALRQEVRRLIDTAMKGSSEVANQFPNDLDRRLKSATAYVAVANLCADFPVFSPEIEESHRRLWAESRALLAAFPHSTKCQWQCAMNFRNWAFAVLVRTDRKCLLQAEQAYLDAIELMKGKTLVATDSVAVSHYLASTHGHLGDLLLRLGKPDEAEREFRVAINLYAKRPSDLERTPVEEMEFALDQIRSAYLLATRGQRIEASQLLDRAADSLQRLNNTDFTAKYIAFLALVRLQLQDYPGYRSACEALQIVVDESGDTSAPVLLPWACGLGPQALDDLKPALQQAEANVANSPMQAPYLDHAVLGAVLYRMREFDQAATHLEESIAQYPSDQPIGTGSVEFPQFLLAMTRWQQGQRNEARRVLDEATSHFEEALSSPSSLWQRRAQLEVLRHEAEGLIAPPEAGMLDGKNAAKGASK